MKYVLHNMIFLCMTKSWLDGVLCKIISELPELDRNSKMKYIKRPELLRKQNLKLPFIAGTMVHSVIFVVVKSVFRISRVDPRRAPQIVLTTAFVCPSVGP